MLNLQYDQDAEYRIIRQEGIEQGERKKAVEMAKEMLQDGNELEKISKYTKLSLSILKKLASEI